MICPHCRHETLEWPCEGCGLAKGAALRRAGETAEGLGRWKDAAKHWEALSSLGESDEGIRKREALCLVRQFLRLPSQGIFQRAADLLADSLSADNGWEEGHSMRILLFQTAGRLTDLEPLYRSQGEEGKRWSDLMETILKFQAEGMTLHRKPGGQEWVPWWRTGVLAALSLGAIALGAEWAVREVRSRRGNLFFPLALALFGALFAVAAPIASWKSRSKRTKTEGGGPLVP